MKGNNQYWLHIWFIWIFSVAWCIL